ncbi:MAG: hypothetical protein GX051_01950 [Clostridiales bacterium]|nr:hypothetical protein [Clostridiales bacterium]
MNKLKQTLLSFRNDGSDVRKNDLWRILLFSFNYSGSAAIMIPIGKWAYYTQNVLQLGLLFSSIILPMRILDAVTDPLIAALFDRYESKHGKYRPFMLFGVLMTIIPSFAVFFYPVNPEGIPTFVSYIILGTCYAIITVGNTILSTATGAGQAIITQDPKQRPLYSLGQTASEAIVSAFVSIVLTSGLVGEMQDPKVWKIAICVLSVASLGLVLVAMKAIETRDNPTYYSVSSHQGKTDMSEFFRLFRRSKPLRSLIAATASDAVAKSVRATMAIYLFANIIMNRGLSSAFDIIGGVIFGLPVLLFGMVSATKKGSAVVYTKLSVVQTIIALAGFFVCLIFLPANPEYAYTTLTFSAIVVMLSFGFYISTLGISTNLVNAMIGDLSDYEYTQSGKFIPGTVSATLTFCNKLISSVVSVITMGIMAFCGFGGKGASSVVPENCFVNYRFYYCILISVFIFPAIGHFITYVAMRKYPVTGEKMNEVSMQLANERGLLPEENVTK